MKKCFGERWRHTSSGATERRPGLIGNSRLQMLVLSCIVFTHRDHRDALLGHSSVVMTLDTYSHVLPSMQKAASEKLENMLFDKSGIPFAQQLNSIQLSKSVND